MVGGGGRGMVGSLGVITGRWTIGGKVRAGGRGMVGGGGREPGMLHGG